MVSRQDYSRLGGPCVKNGLSEIKGVGLHRANVAKWELCFPHLPPLRCSGAAGTPGGVLGEAERSKWNNSLRVIVYSWPPRCQESANGPVQPFLEHLLHPLGLLARCTLTSVMKVRQLLLEVSPITDNV